MRRLAAFAALLLAGPAFAQAPPVVVHNNVNAVPVVAADPGPLPAVLPAAPCADAPVFGLDLMLGMMTGLRAEGSLWQAPGGSLRVEGFYGALFTKFGSAESLGAGLRWQTRRTAADGCHAIVFGPGCDVLFHLQDGNLVLLAPTVELAWHRTIRDTAGWVLGINAGIGVAVGGDDTDGDSAAGRVTPLISGFTGFRY
jgi:hypothetical protein